MKIYLYTADTGRFCVIIQYFRYDWITISTISKTTESTFMTTAVNERRHISSLTGEEFDGTDDQEIDNQIIPVAALRHMQLRTMEHPPTLMVADGAVVSNIFQPTINPSIHLIDSPSRLSSSNASLARKHVDMKISSIHSRHHLRI